MSFSFTFLVLMDLGSSASRKGLEVRDTDRGRRGGGALSPWSHTKPSPPCCFFPPQVFEFSITEKEYTAWSRKLQQLGLHKDWLQRDTPITHITFHPKKASYLLLHDTHMFCIVDKSLVSPCSGPCHSRLFCSRRQEETPRPTHSGPTRSSQSF